MFPVRIGRSFLGLVVALSVLAVAPPARALAASAATTPTCKTVPGAVVNSTIGGGAKATASRSGNAAQLICTYGGSHDVTIVYQTKQTMTDFTGDFSTSYSDEQTIKGIGTKAEYGIQAFETGTQYLWILDGTTVVTIEASKTTVAAMEALARKVVALL